MKAHNKIPVKKSHKGFTTTIIMLILLLTFLSIYIIMYYKSMTSKNVGLIEVVDAYWMINGKRMYSCNLNDEVEAHIIVKAINDVSNGVITVRIKKDRVLMPDLNLISEEFTISLNKGETRELTLKFKPDQAISIILRGYFIELEGLIKWTMPPTYPPRLKVTS